jgi:hypothetical protein
MRNVAMILFVFVFSALTSCNKHENEPGPPKCIEDKIISFNKTFICEEANVTEYVFQGKTVYVFNPGYTCRADMVSEVIDSDCNTLGYLGGFFGNKIINGEDFSKARLIKIIWGKKVEPSQ